MSPTPPDKSPTKVLIRRYVAHVIDALLYAAVAVVTFVLLAERYTTDDLPDRLALFNPDAYDRVDTFAVGADRAVLVDDRIFVLERSEIWIVAAVALGVVLLFDVFIQGRKGWTVGKTITGVRTVNREGDRPGIFRSLIRTLLLVIDQIPGVFIPVVGGVVAASTDDHRRVGDLVGGTYVVRRSAVGEDPTGARDDDVHGWRTLDEHPGHVTTLSDGEPVRVGDAATSEPLSQRTSAVAAAPAAAAGAAGAEKAPAYQPQWDPARQAYLQWDPRKQVWLQFDDDGGEWRPI